MALPKCKDCGIRLTTLKEINGNNGYCNDCHKKNMRIAEWARAAIGLLIALIIYWLIFGT